MDLGTFGAILGFALAREERAAAFYEQAAQGNHAALFQELARGARKRRQRLEQARREGVAEMILEPITGLDGDSYQADLDPSAGQVELLRQARALEETAARFYQDAAAKIPIREVARLMQQLAQESRQRAGRIGD